jgi:hypothetical protein
MLCDFVADQYMRGAAGCHGDHRRDE